VDLLKINGHESLKQTGSIAAADNHLTRLAGCGRWVRARRYKLAAEPGFNGIPKAINLVAGFVLRYSYWQRRRESRWLAGIALRANRADE
jgi:hypothetical protein